MMNWHGLVTAIWTIQRVCRKGPGKHIMFRWNRTEKCTKRKCKNGPWNTKEEAVNPSRAGREACGRSCKWAAPWRVHGFRLVEEVAGILGPAGQEWTACVFRDSADEWWRRRQNTQADKIENEARKLTGDSADHKVPECLFKRLIFIKRSTESHWKFYEDNASSCLKDGLVKQTDGHWRLGGYRQRTKTARQQPTSVFQKALF